MSQEDRLTIELLARKMDHLFEMVYISSRLVDTPSSRKVQDRWKEVAETQKDIAKKWTKIHDEYNNHIASVQNETPKPRS